MTADLASLFLLDPDVTFLNHGSYGACPVPVFAAYQAWQRELERQPVAFLNRAGALGTRLRVVRTALATEVGTHPDNLALFSNATSALNVVLQSLDLKPGDEIVTTDHEYAAMDKTLAHVCAQSEAVVVRAELPLPHSDENAFAEAVLAKLSSRSRVLFLSHITSATALVFPLARIVAEARRRGITTIIDGAHVPGQIPLNLDRLGADFYAGNCHKWMMAPKGSAFLYARPAMQHVLQPAIISHGWTAARHEQGPFGNAGFIDALEMQGTRDPSAWLAIPDALDFAKTHHWSVVRKSCRDLAQATAAEINNLSGYPALGSAEFCAPQMVAVRVPHCDPAVLHARLLESYQIELPCHNWKEMTLVRFSVQGYTTKADTQALVRALCQVFAWG